MRRARAASTEARAHVQILERQPYRLENRDLRGRGPHPGTAHDLREVGDHVFRAERALADRDRQLSGLGERRFPRLHDDAGAQHRAGVQLPRRRLIAADGVHVHAGDEPVAVEERVAAGRACGSRLRRERRRPDVGADPRSRLRDERPRSLRGARHDGDVPSANRHHRLEVRTGLHTAPKITSRSASGLARWRVASPDTAAVRAR